MERILGLRVSSKEVSWALVTGSRVAPNVLAQGRIPVHKNAEHSLTHFRDRVQMLVEEHQPDRASFRAIEPKAKPNRSFFPRIRIEGVLRELLHRLGVSATTVVDASVKSALDTDGSISSYKSASEFRGVDFSCTNATVAEAVVVATASLSS